MFEHTPVLLDEALAALQVREAGRYLDATFGRGGHTAAILQRIEARDYDVFTGRARVPSVTKAATALGAFVHAPGSATAPAGTGG